MKRINFVILALLSILFLFAWSCSDSAATFDSLLDSHAEQTEKAYITFAPLQSRTILPAYSVDDMTNFVLSGTHAGNTETLGTFATKTALLSARIAIEEGSWAFTLTAKKGGSTFTGSVSYEVKMGDNPLSFSLSLDEENISAQDGKGTVLVKITFPADSGVQLVKAGLFNEETDEAISGFELESIAITDNAITYKKEEVPAGTYRLKAFFYGDENAQVYMNTFKEIVVVAADCTSSAERNIEKLNELYTVHYERNGGNFASGSVIQETFSRHSEIALPTSEMIYRAGYEFKGWYADSTFTQAVTEIASGTTESVTVWAKWVVTAEILDEFDANSISGNEVLYYEGNLTTDNLSAFCDKLAQVECDFTLDLSEATGMTTISYKNYDNGYHSYFENCSNLKVIVLSNVTTKIDTFAFKNCTSLENVIFDNNVKNIGWDSFSGCTSLKSITVPASVKYIGPGAFEKCTSLETATVLAPVTSLGGSTFYGCTNLQTVNLPESLTSLSSSMFYNCRSLASITIPESVTSIEDSAFYGCKALESIVISESVKTIGKSVFEECENLKKVFHTGNLSTWLAISFSDNPCRNAADLYINDELVTDVVIPIDIVSIGDYAFYGCASLSTLTIPSNVSSIGTYAFVGCSNLKTVYYTGNLNGWLSISFSNNPCCNGADLYINNELVSDFIIPSDIVSISDYAFYGCASLATLTIPTSVSSIGTYAFCACKNLTAVSISSTISFGTAAFPDCTKLEKVTVESLEVWLSTSFQSWSANPCCNGADLYIENDLVTDVVIPETISVLNDYSFEGCTSLKSITIPDTVSEIGKETFYKCVNLSNVILPSNLETIKQWTFSYCSNLETITIPVSVTSIEKEAFSYCTKLAKIIFLGTKAQWNAITKGTYWKLNVPATKVTCSDGEV